ncbi:MAG: hypothetical protein LBO74_16400 [Candidatus Symbiothrix sp.]|jgi:hypothetical protein|nr:hypothetical protein [Candidatus Symbiothrix sp.]
METAEIMYKINRMPKRQRMFIAERIIHSVRAEEQNTQLKKAVACLYNDYCTDKDLTVFTQLDFENFYETR